MNEVKRYELSRDKRGWPIMKEMSDGDYVSFSDYQNLEKEISGWKIKNETLSWDKFAQLEKELADEKEKLHQVLKYCRDKTDYMWSASIVGIIFNSDLRDSEEILNAYLKEEGQL